jgi:hypothetical protein
MKFLTSGMADLKLRLLDRIVQPRNTPAPSDLSSETTDTNKTIICQAVEDRICKRIDLAIRTDLTVRQAKDALRLLIGIVRRSGLPIDFSPLEIALLTRGIPRRMCYEPMPTVAGCRSPF